MTPTDHVSEEWVLVPRDPTAAMLNAAIDVDSYKLGDISPIGFRCSPQMLFERCYAAMLSAAPTPPSLPAGSAEGVKLVAAGHSAKLPLGYLWGPDAMEHFELGKRQATAAIIEALGVSLASPAPTQTGEGQ